MSEFEPVLVKILTEEEVADYGLAPTHGKYVWKIFWSPANDPNSVPE